MSGSNDPGLQMLMLQMRQQRQPSTQSRLAQMMMAANAQQAQTPVWGTGATLARAGSGVLAGLMGGMAERADQQREERLLQQTQDRAEKRDYLQGQEAAEFGRRFGLTPAAPNPDGTPGAPQAAPNWRQAALEGLGSNNPAIQRQAQAALAIGQLEDQQAARQEQARLARELAVASRAPRAPDPFETALRQAGIQPGSPEAQALARQRLEGRPSQVAAPQGYRPTPDGGLEPIPGGPADPTAAERLAAARRAAQPVPQFLQRAESDDLEMLGTASNINQMLARYEGMMARGEIPTTLVGRGTAFVQNNLGRSTPESQNLASFRSDLERLRNESLRLNNGVQTEGDAQRAWNELISNMNDPAIVERRLREIQGYNQMAIELRQNLINQRRANFNLPELDTARFRAPVPAPPPSVQPPPMPGAEMPQAAPVPAAAPERPGNGGLIDRARARNAAQQPVPRISSPEEMEQLPSGARFIAPDGSMRVKP